MIEPHIAKLGAVDLAWYDLGGSGENEKIATQVVDPAIAQQATDILHTVVTSGTGKNAQVGDDFIWGKTGTTDNNADAWFAGANEDITVAVWVGYPDGSTPMTTEYGGLPVDGGTIPALIWSDVVAAWDEIAAAEGDEPETETTGETTTDETTEAAPPVTEEVPLEPAPVTEPAPEPEPVAPAAEPPPTPAAPPESGGGTGSTGGAVGVG